MNSKIDSKRFVPFLPPADHPEYKSFLDVCRIFVLDKVKNNSSMVKLTDGTTWISFRLYPLLARLAVAITTRTRVNHVVWTQPTPHDWYARIPNFEQHLAVYEAEMHVWSLTDISLIGNPKTDVERLILKRRLEKVLCNLSGTSIDELIKWSETINNESSKEKIRAEIARRREFYLVVRKREAQAILHIYMVRHHMAIPYAGKLQIKYNSVVGTYTLWFDDKPRYERPRLDEEEFDDIVAQENNCREIKQVKHMNKYIAAAIILSILLDEKNRIEEESKKAARLEEEAEIRRQEEMARAENAREVARLVRLEKVEKARERANAKHKPSEEEESDGLTPLRPSVFVRRPLYLQLARKRNYNKIETLETDVKSLFRGGWTKHTDWVYTTRMIPDYSLPAYKELNVALSFVDIPDDVVRTLFRILEECWTMLIGISPSFREEYSHTKYKKTIMHDRMEASLVAFDQAPRHDVGAKCIMGRIHFLRLSHDGYVEAGMGIIIGCINIYVAVPMPDDHATIRLTYEIPSAHYAPPYQDDYTRVDKVTGYSNISHVQRRHAVKLDPSRWTVFRLGTAIQWSCNEHKVLWVNVLTASGYYGSRPLVFQTPSKITPRFLETESSDIAWIGKSHLHFPGGRMTKSQLLSNMI